MVPEGALSTGAVSPSGCTEGPLLGGSRAKRDWTGHGPFYVLVPNCKSPQASTMITLLHWLSVDSDLGWPSRALQSPPGRPNAVLFGLHIWQPSLLQSGKRQRPSAPGGPTLSGSPHAAAGYGTDASWADSEGGHRTEEAHLWRRPGAGGGGLLPGALWHRVGGGRGQRYLWSWADDGLRPPQSKWTAGVGAAAGRCERCVASGVQAHHPLAWRILILYGAPLSSGLIAMFCRPYYSESRRPESTFLSTFLVVCQ